MKLLAISDLHLGYEVNRQALEQMTPHLEDWIIVAGDIGARPEHLDLALRVLTARFARVFWVPGNHDLWSPTEMPDATRGQARYDELVAACRALGVVTPEDPYEEWPDEPGTFIVPMFLLYDYSFRPPEIVLEDAVAWARETGVRCADERMLDPSPWPSKAAWCHARCALTQARLETLPGHASTVLVNHWPLRYDLARPPRIPRFSVWCGTHLTETWGRHYRARAVVSGHLHFRTTMSRQGVRYEEVSLGYPREWRQERGLDGYLREILPGTSEDAQRFVPGRDPFR